MIATRLRIFSFFFICIFFTVFNLAAQKKNDSVRIDSLSKAIVQTYTADSLAPKKTYSDIIKQNKFLNTASQSISFIQQKKKAAGKEFLFYLLSSIVLLFGILKVFYSRYFNNIFRVFFNTSLRQNQLTDILLQARLPSLIFNIFFVITSGVYAWLLFNHYNILKQTNITIQLPICIISLGLIYFGKFFGLKFIGWITGMPDFADTYIFVIFLINKIIGVILIPFIILLAFANPLWVNIIIQFSFGVMGLLFLLRYLRSYDLLQNQIKVSRFHFLLYIIAVEILPVIIISKLIITIL